LSFERKTRQWESMSAIMTGRSRVGVWPSVVLVATAVALAASPAGAQDGSADTAAARELGIEGVRAADAGDCATAIDRLSRAEQIRHAPTTAARLGECQIKVGKLVDGTETLRRLVRETLPAGSPPVFTQAQERARVLLAETKPKIGQLKIAVAAPPNAEFAVKIDGVALPLANLNVNRPIDPGEHVIEASGKGLLPAKTKVVIPEGGSDSAALTLQPDPNAAPPPTPVVVTPTRPGPGPIAPPPPPPPAPPNHTPAWVTLGVGGAGLVLGAVFGGVALSDKSSINNACPGKVCPSSEQSSLNSAKTLANLSTAMFVIGGVGVALGGTLLFTNNFQGVGGEDSAPPKSALLKLQTFVTPGGGGIRGEF